MADDEENQKQQPDWSNLPGDLLEPIGKRTRDAVTGVSAFRSVCRAWRAAVAPAPRLLLPRARGPNYTEDALVIPLSHGWSIVIDACDASCRLSHLATGATAALPSLNAVRRAGTGSDDAVTYYLPYLHRPDMRTAIRIRTWFPCISYLEFTDNFRFAVHVPPSAAAGAPPPAVAASLTIMMASAMLGPPGTGMHMLCCRPGDAAWTTVNLLVPMPTFRTSYIDLAYHDGKMFGMDTGGETTVFDAATLRALCTVRRPPATPNLANKLFPLFTNREEFNFVHLVALPSKLVLVRFRFKYSRPPSQSMASWPTAEEMPSRPVAVDVFELGSTPDGLAWLKATDAGNYELYLDGYHTTFRENNDGGTRIYYVHDFATAGFIDDKYRIPPAAYCYSMQDNKLECIYVPPDDIHEYLTKPGWFLP